MISCAPRSKRCSATSLRRAASRQARLAWSGRAHCRISAPVRTIPSPPRMVLPPSALQHRASLVRQPSRQLAVAPQTERVAVSGIRFGSDFSLRSCGSAKRRGSAPLPAALTSMKPIRALGGIVWGRDYSAEPQRSRAIICEHTPTSATTVCQCRVEDGRGSLEPFGKRPFPSRLIECSARAKRGARLIRARSPRPEARYLAPGPAPRRR